MTNPKWDEEILAVSREELFAEQLAFQGLQTEQLNVDLIMENLASNIQVVRRGNTADPTPKENNAEINPELKQPIPYAIIKQGGNVFMYERLGGGGEARLHSKLSIGVGGHMNKLGGKSFNEELYYNLKRELDEELDIQGNAPMHLETIGFINDDEDEVGRVHLGLLVIVTLSDTHTVEVREKDKLYGTWVLVQDIAKEPLFDRLESWSKIAVQALKQTDSTTV